MGTSIGAGRKAGTVLALGIFGSLTWALLTYALALTAIKMVGGIYLLWLAYKAFKSALTRSDIGPKTLAGGRRTPLEYFVRGYTIQMTNPKSALVWVAVVALGLTPDAPFWVDLVIVAGTFMLSIAHYLFYVLLFSTIYDGARLHPRTARHSGKSGRIFRLCGPQAFVVTVVKGIYSNGKSLISPACWLPS